MSTPLSRADPLVAALSEAAGGEAGVHARTGRCAVPVCLAWFTVVFVAAMLVAGFTEQAPVGVLVQAPAMALCGLAATWLLAWARPGDPWAAAGFAVSPVLLTVGYAGHGLVMALGVAAVLGLVGRIGLPARSGAICGATLGVVLVLTWAWTSGPHRLSAAWTALAHDTGGRGTLWYVIAQLGGAPPPALVAAFGVAALVGGVALVAVLMATDHPPTTGQAAALVLILAFLLGRWYSPSDALWLLPLAAVTGLRWRDLLGWQAFAVFGWAMDLALDVQFDKQSVLAASTGGTPIYTWAMLIRLGGLVWLLAAVLLAVADGPRAARSVHVAG